MQSLFNSLEEALSDIIAEAQASGETVSDETLKDLLEQTKVEAAGRIKKTLYKRAKGMLRERRSLNGGFERRHFKRWCPALDHLEMLWVICEEVGAEFNREFRPAAAAADDYVFESMSRLHARSLLVASECLCLLKGGFADGALSRWRSLHELFVVGVFIKQHGLSTAERYLASFEFRRFEAAEQLNQFSARANLRPFTARQMAVMKKRRDDLEKVLGPEMRNEYGWAFGALTNKRPTFAIIEANIGLDHWRPRYKWASQHTHAGARPTNAFLGTSESTEDVLLVGQSNSGLVDPLQMIALTLASSTTMLISTRPAFDVSIIGEIIMGVADEMAPIAIAREQETLDAARKKQRKKKD